MNTELTEVLRANMLGPVVNTTALLAALEARENDMADSFRLTAERFGLMSFVVDEAIATVHLGTDPTPERRQEIRDRFEQGMAEIRERYQREHGDDG